MKSGTEWEEEEEEEGSVGGVCGRGPNGGRESRMLLLNPNARFFCGRIQEL